LLKSSLEDRFAVRKVSAEEVLEDMVGRPSEVWRERRGLGCGSSTEFWRIWMMRAWWRGGGDKSRWGVGGCEIDQSRLILLSRLTSIDSDVREWCEGGKNWELGEQMRERTKNCNARDCDDFSNELWNSYHLIFPPAENVHQSVCTTTGWSNLYTASIHRRSVAASPFSPNQHSCDIFIRIFRTSALPRAMLSRIYVVEPEVGSLHTFLLQNSTPFTLNSPNTPNSDCLISPISNSARTAETTKLHKAWQFE